jgi:hypothetical protein
VGRTVLEIGPGRDMGTALPMSGLGASHVIAVDRFKGAWQDGWYDAFIDRLLGATGRLGAPVDDGVTRRALAAKNQEVGPVEFLAEAFESVGDRFLDDFDVSVSHSTFEHFYSVEKAAAVLADRTYRESVGVHNVDFRDYANFGEPFKSLLIDDQTYADPKVNSDCGRGNRVRAGAMVGILRKAGFNRVETHADLKANADYLSRFVPALKKSGGTRMNLSLEDLEILSATLVLRR